MLELATVALAATYAGYRLVRGAMAREEEPPPSPPAIPEEEATPARRERPRTFDYPLFTPYRGAVRTTQEGVAEFLSADPGSLFALAGVMWPARKFLNKLTLITGRPESGKTAMLRMMMESVARLFPVLEAQAAAGLYPGRGMMRWLVVDPTNAYLPFLYQCLPGDVPIIRATPFDQGSSRWNVSRDISSDSLNEALQEGLFPESLFRKAGDPFWYTKAREVTEGLVNVYHDRKSAWEFHDIIVPIKYPQFLRPVLMQSPRTRGKVHHDLVGRLGRDIVSTSSSVVNRMAIAASLWRHATKTFSVKEFLEGREVLHFAYSPDLIASLAGIANAVTHVLVMLGMKRNDPYDHTMLWLDEGRYLADLAGLEHLAARGRGAGFGAVFAAQGTPGLISKWGEGRVKELLDLICTWVALSSGPETAEAFSRAVGKVEGLQKSYGYSFTSSWSTTYGWNSGRTSSWSGGSSTSSGQSYSTTFSSSTTYSENFQLVIKEAVLSGELTNLPLASPERDNLCGFVFNPEVGAFEFDTPFLHHFQDLAEPPFPSMPMRPDEEQRLMPWTEDDLRRLLLEPTPELIKALKDTWDNIGRMP